MNTLEASTCGVSDRYLMYAGGFMSPMQRCFSDLVCQPLVTSCVIDAYLCLTMLHAWILEYQHMMLCIWWWIYLRRQKGQLEKTTGSPSQCLAQQDSGGSQHCNAIYAVEIWHRQGSRSGATVHLDCATTTMMMMMMMMMMKDDLCQKWRVKLIFQGTYRLSRTGIAGCLKIIGVGYNLKQIWCRGWPKMHFSFSARKWKWPRKWNSLFGQKNENESHLCRYHIT